MKSKKGHIIMLPANNSGKLQQKRNDLISNEYDLEINVGYPDSDIVNNGYNYYNLYVISDDEIKAGDWYTSFNHNTKLYEAPLKAKLTGTNEWDVSIFKDVHKKIISTTDISLKVIDLENSNGGKFQSTKFKLLPNISNKFIKEFCATKKDNIECEICEYSKTKLILSINSHKNCLSDLIEKFKLGTILYTIKNMKIEEGSIYKVELTDKNCLLFYSYVIRDLLHKPIKVDCDLNLTKSIDNSYQGTSYDEPINTHHSLFLTREEAEIELKKQITEKIKLLEDSKLQTINQIEKLSKLIET